MSGKTSFKLLQLILTISSFVLWGLSPEKIISRKEASEQWEAPFDQDIPADPDDQNGPSDNEFDDEDYAILFNKYLAEFPSLQVKQMTSARSDFFSDHKLEIITPPPRC